MSDDMIALLKSGRVDNSLLCELTAHPDFPRLMADLEIYVNGTAVKQVQSANALVDAARAAVIKRRSPGESDTHLRQLTAAHLDEERYCRYVIQQDMDELALALREVHKDDFFSVPADNPAEQLMEFAEQAAAPGADPDGAAMMFICKALRLNYAKLTDDEKEWFKKIAEKSDLLKNPNPQRGRKRK